MKKQKKIVIFTPNLNVGGISRVLLTYAKGLSENRHEVIYLTSTYKGDFSDIAESFSHLQYMNLGVSRLRQSLFALVRFLKKNSPDIIITANESTLIVLLSKWLSFCSAKLIASHHNYSDCDKFTNNMIVRYGYPFCDKIIAVSRGISSMLTDEFKINPDKVVTIYNPIDAESILQSQHVKPHDAPSEYILFVGRLSKVKNLQLLFKAFSLFFRKYHNVELLIIGDNDKNEKGNGRKDLEELAVELNLSEVIHFTGVKTNPFPYIKHAKIIALSSLSEALPTILIEGFILGKTIVSTPTLGAIDILENGNYGYLSDSFTDIESFANILEKAYKQPLNEEMLINAVKRKYDLNSKISEIEKLWQDK
jgi:glycosyltransferase involved in cell wall biosynthesis